MEGLQYITAVPITFQDALRAAEEAVFLALPIYPCQVLPQAQYIFLGQPRHEQLLMKFGEGLPRAAHSLLLPSD